jgi:hypothetical protein
MFFRASALVLVAVAFVTIRPSTAERAAGARVAASGGAPTRSRERFVFL